MPAVSIWMFPYSVPALRRRMIGAIKRASRVVADCAASCREGYAANTLYKELLRLSDAELDGRGLTRDELFRRLGDQLGEKRPSCRSD